jgi:hypothetical protein
VPRAWRALGEVAAGGDRRRRKVTAAVNAARRYAWARGTARHGALPPVQVADRELAGVTCIRLDATVVPAHSDNAHFNDAALAAEFARLREVAELGPG